MMKVVDADNSKHIATVADFAKSGTLVRARSQAVLTGSASR
jgi:hypothetical protein